MGFLAPMLPMLGKLGMGLGGSLLGGLGKSGNKQDNKYNSQTDQTQEFQRSDTQSSSQEGTGSEFSYSDQIEDPYVSSFRQGLLPVMSQELKRAQQPVFGEAQKASFMNNLNDLADNSFASLQGNLARTGGLDSGRLSQGASDIETKRFGDYSGFMSQLPFMEEQSRAGRVNPLLNMAASFVGQAPRGQFNIGNRSSSQTGEASGTSQGTSKTSTTASGTGQQTGGQNLGNAVAGQAGGLLGSMFGDWMKTGKFPWQK